MTNIQNSENSHERIQEQELSQNAKKIGSDALENKDKRIELLESELSKYRGDAFSFSDLSKEAKINYYNFGEIGYSNLITTNFNKTDTIPTFKVTWNSEVKNSQLKEEQGRLVTWLKLRLKLDTLAVKKCEIIRASCFEPLLPSGIN